MKSLFIFLLLVGFQNDLPYKPSDEFQVNVDLSFKPKDSGYSPSTYNQNGERLDRMSTSPLPFLNVSVTQIKAQSDEAKIVAVDSQGKSLTRKKISPDIVLNFQMGFVDDLKKGAPNREVTIFFVSEEKKNLRRIVISVAPNGVFAVNGKWHGQF